MKKKYKLIIIFILIISIITFSSYLLNNHKDNNPIDKPSDKLLLMLVNYDNIIPIDYKPDLVEYDGYKMSKYILSDYQKMYKDAKKNGYNLEISSAYRSISEQKEIYNHKYNGYIELGMTKEDAKYLTEKEVAVPGYSEHVTGLALDISIIGNLDDKEKAWDYLKKNSYKYGFINRYPEDKVNITKIEPEPWHYRYVGYENAKNIYNNNLTLEEYLLN